MKKIIPKDSRYVPLTQQKWCCVPTCIQMIMLRHKITLIPAELLGYEMGLIVPKEDEKLFCKVRTGKMPPAGYGTQEANPKFDPNIAFKRLKIPLKFSRNFINNFSDYRSFLKYLKNFDNSKDVMACFDWGTLFDKSHHGGHVCLIDKIDMEKKKVRLIDPSPKYSKWTIVSMKKLFKAMKFHEAKKSGGFWEIEFLGK